MKTAAVCVVCALGAFLAMHLHLTGQLGGSEEEAEAVADKKKEDLPPTRFPQDLGPAIHSAPVPRAAAFNPANETHPTAVLTLSGKLHDWYERLQPDWRAESVEGTELLLVVKAPQATLLQTVTYPNGAPPVRRYQYDQDVWLVEAKTGKVIDRNRFTTVARPVRPQEPWELTHLGDPPECATVLAWLRERATAHAEQLTSAK